VFSVKKLPSRWRKIDPTGHEHNDSNY